jgi:hypothetical protein
MTRLTTLSVPACRQGHREAGTREHRLRTIDSTASPAFAMPTVAA